jgi:hypothetical protein
VFASDLPSDAEGGAYLVTETIRSPVRAPTSLTSNYFSLTSN